MTIRQIFLAPDGRARPTWRALLFIPTFVLLALLASQGLAITAGAWLSQAPKEWNLLVGTALSVVCVAVASLGLLRLLDRRSVRTLGLWLYDGWQTELLAGLGLGVGLLSLTVAPLLLSGRAELHPVGVSPATLAGVALAGAILMGGAVNEELLFRGYPFQRLVEGWGPVITVAVFSGLFGLAHLHNPNPTLLSTVNTMLAGVVLAVSYLRTRGLWLPIGLHFAWNFWMAPVLGFPVSGIELKLRLLTAQVGEPQWLTGGSYGPEGSILCTVVLVGATLWLARTKRLSVSPAQARELE
jgi:membrane protease YdiL (CAAX protease family)